MQDDVEPIWENMVKGKFKMQEFKPKNIVTKIYEMEEMHKELRLVGKRISEHLGVDELSIEFAELKDESINNTKRGCN